MPDFKMDENFDLVVENDDIAIEDGLQTAVIISMFSDRRAELEDLSRPETNQRGYWADRLEDTVDRWGSLLWLFARSKVIQESANAAKEYVENSLEWMIEDGIAQQVNVETELVSSERIDISIEIVRPVGENVSFRYSQTWQAEGERER